MLLRSPNQRRQHMYDEMMSGRILTSSQQGSAAGQADLLETHSLEVQVGETTAGEAIWRDAGPVELLDHCDGETPLLCSGMCSGDDAASPAMSLPMNTVPGRAQLSASVKRWFGAKTKQERQRLYLYRHAPDDAPNTNLLIMLHGTGDSHRPFDKLGQRMKLPQTAVMSISARHKFVELPFQLGHSWFQEVDYCTTGDVLPRDHSTRQSSLSTAAERFCDLLQLLGGESPVWIPERVFLFGYGAGASLAMAACQLWCTKYRKPALGGTVCVAGGDLVAERSEDDVSSSQVRASGATPILMMVGSQDDTFPPDVARSLQQRYQRECSGAVVEVHVQPQKGQGMISNEEEMRVVMTFLASKLVRVSKMGQT